MVQRPLTFPCVRSPCEAPCHRTSRPDVRQSSACAASLRATAASSEQQRSKVGFPIRKFPDQSLFAAPRNLSQRTTSFIASQRQGIHQIPLRHLIALIAKARSFSCPRSANRTTNALLARKDQFCFKRIRDPSGQAQDPRLVLEGSDVRDGPVAEHGLTASHDVVSPHPALDRMRFLFTMSDIERSWPASGQRTFRSTLPSEAARRPSPLESSPERTKLIISSERIRIVSASPVGNRRLAIRRSRQRLVEPDGIEPTTSCLQSTRSPN